MNISEVIVELRELNQNVPKPMRLPTAAEITVAEQKLGVTLHPDYRQYLLEASDVVVGTLEPATVSNPNSRTYLVKLVVEARKLGVPHDCVPICDDNGNYYCLSQDGKVRFWDHNGSNDESWPSLAQWITDVWIKGG